MFDLTRQRNGFRRGFEIPKNWDFCGAADDGKYPLQKKSKSAGRNRLVVNIGNLAVTYLRGGAFLQERKEGGNFAGEIIKTVTL